MNVDGLFEKINSISDSINKKIMEFNKFISKVNKFQKISMDYLNNIDLFIKTFDEEKTKSTKSVYHSLFKTIIVNIKKLLETLISETSEILKDLFHQEDFKKLIKINFNELKRIQKEMDFSNVEKIKTKYLNDLRELEYQIIKFKLNKNNMTKYERIMSRENVQTLIIISKENEKNYIKVVNEKNKKIEECNVEFTSICHNINNIDDNLQSSYNNIINSYISSFKMISENIGENILNITNSLNTINEKTKGNNIEERNIERYLIKDRFYFFIYKPKIFELMKQKKIQKEGIDISIMLILKKNFICFSKDEKFKNQFNKIRIDKICSIILNDIKDKLLSEKTQIFLFENLKNIEYRQEFLKYLNKSRANGKFKINKYSFIQLGIIIRSISDYININIEKDFETLKYLIIMSQTYYFENYKNKKIYLVRCIEQHPLFQEEEFWECYIDNYITTEKEKSETNGNANGVLSIQSVSKNNNFLIFSWFLNIGQIMLDFKLDRKMIIKLVKNEAIKINFDKSMIEDCCNSINEMKCDNNDEFDIENHLIDKGEKVNKESSDNQVDAKIVELLDVEQKTENAIEDSIYEDMKVFKENSMIEGSENKDIYRISSSDIKNIAVSSSADNQKIYDYKNTCEEKKEINDENDF